MIIFIKVYFQNVENVANIIICDYVQQTRAIKAYIRRRAPRRQGIAAASKQPSKCVFPECAKILSRAEKVRKYKKYVKLNKKNKVINPDRILPGTDPSILSRVTYFFENGLHTDTVPIKPVNYYTLNHGNAGE